MKESDYIGYLDVTIDLLYTRALEAKKEYLTKLQTDGLQGASFSSGYALAYQHCLETLLKEAEIFGLPVDQFSSEIDLNQL